VHNKINRSTENERFHLGAEGEAGNATYKHCRWSLTLSRDEISRLNAE
jgi:hypothetical protein